MAARGAESKTFVTKKILDMFEGSFLYEKEIRIPVEENGEILQIKCTLTCAKTNVSPGADEAVPALKVNSKENAFDDFNNETSTITKEEKSEVENLIESLGL